MSSTSIKSTTQQNATFLEGDGLYWGEQYVCNFEPRVESLVESVCDGEAETFVKLKCVFADGSESDTKAIPLSELETIKRHTVDLRCQLSPDCTKAVKYIASMIHSSLSSVPVIKEYVVDRVGVHFIEGHPLFCVGDRVMLSPSIPSDVTIRMESLPSRLAIDGNLSELQAIKEMMKIVNLSPDAGRVIFAHCLLNIMRSVYTEVDKPPRCIPYLVGLTGTKKTTYAAFQTQLYDRDKGIEAPIRLNASIPSAERVLHSKSDCVVVLDDLFPAKSNQAKSEQEKTLVELVRIIGDNIGRARVKGDEVVTREPRCGALVTGEYLIGTGSDAARLLPITFTTPIDNTKLTECQAKPLVLSTFYNYFIEWFITNYPYIRDWLSKMFAYSRKAHLGVHDRLQETHFHLSSAYRIFLGYCLDKGFVSRESAKAQHVSFQNLLTELAKKQDERVSKGENKEADNVDYLGLIGKLYKSGTFRLADNARNLKEKHHGLINENCLCLRSMRLMPEINRYVPNTNINAVIDSLISQNALKVGSDKNTIQISGGGKRFLAIPLKKLK